MKYLPVVLMIVLLGTVSVWADDQTEGSADWQSEMLMRRIQLLLEKTEAEQMRLRGELLTQEATLRQEYADERDGLREEIAALQAQLAAAPPDGPAADSGTLEEERAAWRDQQAALQMRIATLEAELTAPAAAVREDTELASSLAELQTENSSLQEELAAMRAAAAAPAPVEPMASEEPTDPAAAWLEERAAMLATADAQLRELAILRDENETLRQELRAARSAPPPPAPAAVEEPVAPVPPPGPVPEGALDPNRATRTELLALPHMSELVADGIIWYRENIGPFMSVEGLQAVPGMTENLYQRLAPHFSTGQ